MLTRGLVRSVLALTAVLALAAAEPAPASGSKPAVASQPFPPAEARRPADGKDSPEVLALLRQRRDVVKAEVDQAAKSLADPNFRADMWAALAERLLVAETDVAQTPAERVAAYRAFRDNLKRLEDQLQHVPEPSRGQGYFEYGQKLWIHGRRLQAEASLLQAELAKGEPSAGGDLPAVRAALVAWREAVRKWAKMWLESRMLLIPAFAREIANTALTAELAAAKDPAEQRAAYQACRDRLLAIEKDTKAEVERRRYNAFDYLRIKEMRCEADVILGRLRVGNEKPPEADPPAVRAALDEWVETIGFENAVLRKRYEPGKVPPAESLLVDDSLFREESAATTTTEGQIAAYKKLLVKVKEAEIALKAHAADNAAGREDAARATYNRASTERTVLLLQAKPGAATSAAAVALLKEQRDSLRTELELRMAEWAEGRGDFQFVQESAGSLLLAELELADSPAGRIAAYQANAERLRTAEAQAKTLVDTKKGPEAWLSWTRGARLEADVWLLRARRALAPTGNAASEARP
jgi:hypothetical protein